MRKWGQGLRLQALVVAVLTVWFIIAIDAQPVGAQTARPNLSITTTTPVPTYVGGRMTWTLNITNSGAAGTPGVRVVVQNILSEGLTFGGAVGLYFTCTHDGSPRGGTVTCVSHGVLPPGPTTAIEMGATPNGASCTVSSQIVVKPANAIPESSESRNSTGWTQRVTQGCPAELTIQGKADASMEVGGILVYHLDVKNVGGLPAGAYAVRATLSSGVAYLRAAGGGYTCTHLGSAIDGVVTCQAPAGLGAGSANAINVNVTPTGALCSVTNTAEVDIPTAVSTTTSTTTVLGDCGPGHEQPVTTITGFTPTSGGVGTAVTISGTNFIGAIDVTFNGTSATFKVNSATSIGAVVPPGASTGRFSVGTYHGTATTASDFTVTFVPPPPPPPPPDGGGVGFINPQVNGKRVDNCLHWAAQCGKPAADYFCRLKGFESARDFQTARFRPTLVLGDNQECDADTCVGFTRIVCQGGGPPPPPPPPGGCSQWDISGIWQTHQTNNHDPAFFFHQAGTTLSGTATLPQEGCVAGSVAGTLIGDKLDVKVTWPPKANGLVVQGHYLANVAQGGFVNGLAYDLSNPNGSPVVWSGSGPTRCMTQAPPSPNLAGTWYREGDTNKPTSVIQSGNSLTLVNEFGSRSRGHFLSSDVVVADDWQGGLSGKITNNGKRIDWANHTSWQR